MRAVLAPTITSPPPVPADAASASPTAPVAAPAPPQEPAGAASWTLHDQTSATAAIVDAVRGAKEVVNAEFFGFVDSGNGRRLTEALVDAARRGVEVNVITDFVSALAPPPLAWLRMKHKLEDAGGSVILTSRIPGSPRAKATPGLKHVDHRKVVTVDGTTGFVGGMNFIPLTDGYDDTMIGLGGVAAARLGAEQLDRWARVGGKVSARHVRAVERALDGAPPRAQHPTDLAIAVNAPEQGRFELTEGYAELIRGAKERIWIATPGIADRDVMRELQDAARRGVDVRIVASEDAPLVPMIGWVTRAHLTGLAAAGGTAFEIPGTLHRKAIVADDEVIVSSFNLTKRSAEHDHEIGIRSSDPAFVQAVTDVFQRDIDRARRFDPKDVGAIPRALGGFFARHISY